MTSTEVESLVVSLLGDVSQYLRAINEAVQATREATDRIAEHADKMAAAAEKRMKETMASVGKMALEMSQTVVGAFRQTADAISGSLFEAARSSVETFGAYQSSLARIEGLAGANAEQTRKWGQELLALGPSLGKTPVELADAMFFVSSAGLRGKEALSALRESAKASAAGLGDVKTVTHAVTFSLAAYAGTGLTAARATDIFVAAAREGNLDVSALAGTIGSVLPIASAAGISLEQVAASIAVLTHTGSSVAAAGISVQQMLMALVKPGKEATAVLASVGLTFAELRTMSRETDGIIKVMRRLDEAFNHDDEAIAHVIPNIRALRGSLSILSQDASIVDGVMEGVRNSVGATDRAFEVASRTMKFAFDVVKAQVSATAVEIGAILAPTVADVARIAGMVLEWFRGWPGPLKITLAIVALVTAGTVSLALAIAAATLGIIAAGIAFNAAFGGIGFIVGFVVTGAVALYTAIAATVGVTVGLGIAVGHLSGAFDEVRASAIRTWEWLKPVRQALAQLFDTLWFGATVVFAELKRLAMETWRAISGSAEIDWHRTRDVMIDAVLMMEFALLNFERTWEFVTSALRYGVEVVKQEIIHLFSDVLPAALAWLGRNLPAIAQIAWSAFAEIATSTLRTLWEWANAGFQTMTQNIGKIMLAVDWTALWWGLQKAARDVLAGTVAALAAAFAKLPDVVIKKAAFEWEAPVRDIQDQREARRRAAVPLAGAPVADFANIAVEARRAQREAARAVQGFDWPQRRDEGELEAQLRREYELRRDSLAMSFEQFRKMRLDQFAREDAMEAEEVARRAGRPHGESGLDFGKHAKEKKDLDAVLAASAEAAHRIADYRDALEAMQSKAKEDAATREARIMAERALALERELELTNRIAEARREVRRQEELMGLHPPRQWAPGPGEQPTPRQPGPFEFGPPPVPPVQAALAPPVQQVQAPPQIPNVQAPVVPHVQVPPITQVPVQVIPITPPLPRQPVAPIVQTPFAPPVPQVPDVQAVPFAPPVTNPLYPTVPQPRTQVEQPPEPQFVPRRPVGEDVVSRVRETSQLSELRQAQRQQAEIDNVLQQIQAGVEVGQWQRRVRELRELATQEREGGPLSVGQFKARQYDSEIESLQILIDRRLNADQPDQSRRQPTPTPLSAVEQDPTRRPLEPTYNDRQLAQGAMASDAKLDRLIELMGLLVKQGEKQERKSPDAAVIIPANFG